MNWKEMRARLDALWPRVATHDVMSVLQAGERWDQPVPAGLAELFSLEPHGLATGLMAPLAAALPDRRPWDRVEVLAALGALIRAGGDPSDVLDAVVDALGVERTREAAGSVLQLAALHRHDVRRATEALAPHAHTHDDALRDAHTLAALQRAGQLDAIQRVATVLDAHRLGNLRGAVSLVAHQLLSPHRGEVEQAVVALDALLQAGSDRQASWLAVEPVMRTQLRATEPFWQGQAAQAVAQARYALQAPKAASERLEQLVDALADCLPQPDLAVASQSAHALRVLAELGGSLGGSRAKVDAALLDPRETVRCHVSPALSAWLLAAGVEPPLPRGFSHRRIWAASDAPLDLHAPPGRCARCGERGVVVIDELHHRRQFGEDHRIETRCRACGVYRVEDLGWDG